MVKSTPPAPNQSNFHDEQNYKIDIDKIYSDFISEIDAVRSYVNVSGIINSQLSANFTANSPEPTYQESRCHAFYRLIGFPVVNKDQSDIYNPGHASAARLKSPIDLNKRLQIAKDPIVGFNLLSRAREEFALTNAKIFINNTGIDASVLALSSGGTGPTNLRKFSVPFLKNSSDAFNVDPTTQSYSVGATALVGKKIIDLHIFSDGNDNTPVANTLASRKHIIRPFVVDPIIDFTVNPSTRKVAIPFLPDKSYLKMASNVFIKRPLLEKVIRDRFSTLSVIADQDLASSAIIDYIKNIPAIQNQTIITQVTANNNQLYRLDEQSQFVNFLNIIQEMMAQLVRSLNIILKAQSLYYWVPVPSTFGPEKGISSQDVFLTTQLMQQSNLFTQSDRNILLRVVAAHTNQLNSQAAGADGVPDVGGFAFDSFKTTFNSDTSPGLIDVNQQSLDDILSLRTGILNKAGDALRTIEIIMGEFSGFGLCDIIAIMAALYIMPKTSLLGLLDDDAFNRMLTALHFDQDSSVELTQTRDSYVASIDNFERNVSQFYQLMDSIYKNFLEQSGLPT